MAAPKTKKKTTKSDVRKSIQLIVFAPVNADPSDEDNRIYMVCPASLKVVEVVEKYDSAAVEFMSLLGKRKHKNEIAPSTFIDELGGVEEFPEDIIVNASGSGKSVDAGAESDPKNITDELDEDLVTFVGDGVLDIYPDMAGDPAAAEKFSDSEMMDAISILDEDDHLDLPVFDMDPDDEEGGGGLPEL